MPIYLALLFKYVNTDFNWITIHCTERYFSSRGVCVCQSPPHGMYTNTRWIQQLTSNKICWPMCVSILHVVILHIVHLSQQCVRIQRHNYVTFTYMSYWSLFSVDLYLYQAQRTGKCTCVRGKMFNLYIYERFFSFY